MKMKYSGIILGILLSAAFVACVDVEDDTPEASSEEGASSSGQAVEPAGDELVLEIDPQASSCGYSCSGGSAEQQMCCSASGGSCIDIQTSHECDDHFGGNGYFCTCHANRPWNGNWFTTGTPGTCALAGIQCCGGETTCVAA